MIIHTQSANYTRLLLQSWAAPFPCCHRAFHHCTTELLRPIISAMLLKLLLVATQSRTKMKLMMDSASAAKNREIEGRKTLFVARTYWDIGKIMGIHIDVYHYILIYAFRYTHTYIYNHHHHHNYLKQWIKIIMRVDDSSNNDNTTIVRVTMIFADCSIHIQWWYHAM